MLKYYDGSDLCRIKAQQAFIKELIRQKFTIQYFPKINSILNVIYEDVKTNLSFKEVLSLSLYMSKMDINNFNFIPLPGKPQDSSPWYYLCDVEKAREITVQYFQSDEYFVYVDQAARDIYKNNPSISQGIDSVKSGSSGKKDVIKGNPSNADTSLGGGQTPAP